MNVSSSTWASSFSTYAARASAPRSGADSASQVANMMASDEGEEELGLNLETEPAETAHAALRINKDEDWQPAGIKDEEMERRKRPRRPFEKKQHVRPRLINILA